MKKIKRREARILEIDSNLSFTEVYYNFICVFNFFNYMSYFIDNLTGI